VQLLTAVADKAAAIDRTMMPLINKWLNRYVVEKGKAFFSVDRKGLSDDVVASESLMSLLRERNVEFDRFHIQSIEQNKEKIGKTFLLPSGWRYRPQKESLEFYKKGRLRQKSSFSFHLMIGATTQCVNPKAAFSVERFKRKTRNGMSFSNAFVAFLDAGKIRSKGPLVFRSFGPHEKFWPYGAQGYMQVNEFLKKQKLLEYERSGRGVVSLGKNGEILWVVGMRISDRFKITPQTKEILKISCKNG
jgi:tRNA(Ile)-lysidine synthase